MRDERMPTLRAPRRAPCPECLGDGIVLMPVPDGAWAAETEAPCPACLGEGEVEACGRCSDALRLVDGLERCACPAELGSPAEAA